MKRSLISEIKRITSKCWENGDIGILSKTMRKWCVREVSLELLFLLVNFDKKTKNVLFGLEVNFFHKKLYQSANLIKRHLNKFHLEFLWLY